MASNGWNPYASDMKLSKAANIHNSLYTRENKDPKQPESPISMYIYIWKRKSMTS